MQSSRLLPMRVIGSLTSAIVFVVLLLPVGTDIARAQREFPTDAEYLPLVEKHNYSGGFDDKWFNGPFACTRCPAPPGCVPGNQVDRSFFEDILRRLNMPVSEFGVRALQVWQRWENTLACWNPLATTRRIPGWLCNFNCVGVQHYRDREMGIRATVETLSLNYYPAIRDMLALQRFDAQALRTNLQTWGTCSGSACQSYIHEWYTLWQQYVTPCPPPNCVPGGQVDRAFFEEVLSRLNLPVTDFAVTALQYWQQDKSSPDCWNPLETTRNVSPSCTAQARARHFGSRETGIEATVQTLRLNYYTPIRHFLAGGTPDWPAILQALQTWGGCSDGSCQALWTRWQQLWQQYHAPPTPTSTPTSPPPLPTFAPTPSPSIPTLCPDGEFRLTFFANTALQGEPVAGWCTSDLNYSWYFNSPSPGVPADYFSTQAEGRFYFEGGRYHFQGFADDGYRIVIDGQEVDAVWTYGRRFIDFYYDLAPGWHIIRMEHMELEGWADMQLAWQLAAPPVTATPQPTAPPPPTETPTATFAPIPIPMTPPSASPTPTLLISTMPPQREPSPTPTATFTTAAPPACPPANCTPGRAVGRDFYAAVLQRLGIPTTDFAINALQEWSRFENTAACWNPLATTLKLPGRSCHFNPAGVRHYVDKETGVKATAATLQLGYYQAIRAFLRQDVFDQTALYAALGYWTTGNPHQCAYCDGLLPHWKRLWDQTHPAPPPPPAPPTEPDLQVQWHRLDVLDAMSVLPIATIQADIQPVEQIEFVRFFIHYDSDPPNVWRDLGIATQPPYTVTWMPGCLPSQSVQIGVHVKLRNGQYRIDPPGSPHLLVWQGLDECSMIGQDLYLYRASEGWFGQQKTYIGMLYLADYNERDQRATDQRSIRLISDQKDTLQGVTYFHLHPLTGFTNLLGENYAIIGVNGTAFLKNKWGAFSDGSVWVQHGQVYNAECPRAHGLGETQPPCQYGLWVPPDGFPELVDLRGLSLQELQNRYAPRTQQGGFLIAYNKRIWHANTFQGLPDNVPNPATLVGLSGDRRWIYVAVTNEDLETAARRMAWFGATDIILLDGNRSTRMLWQGRDEGTLIPPTWWNMFGSWSRDVINMLALTSHP